MSRAKYLFIGLLLVFETSSLFAFDLPSVFENKIYKKSIRTVQMHRNGWSLSAPVITLNSDESLLLSFDELSQDVEDFYYTVVHCDRNWKQSVMPQSEYLNMFTEFPIVDYMPSVNATVHYINYQLVLPNEDVPLSHSGNYALLVYDRNQPEQPVLSRRFYVVEQLVSIDARIRRGTFDQLRAETQEVDVTVNHDGLRIADPMKDVKLVIMQNNRPDNIISDLKPLYVRNNELEYDYDRENLFKGSNEFRFFETRRIKYPGKNLQSIGQIDGHYHGTLLPANVRSNLRYKYEQDVNGYYLIEKDNSDQPDVEADYIFVHFTLELESQLFGGVYVYGALSDWKCSNENRMKWNNDQNRYELSMLLKQGSYSYLYAWVDGSEPGLVNCENLEGSYSETENDYSIFFYYGQPFDRYDRLVGYSKFNSNINKNYGIKTIN